MGKKVMRGRGTNYLLANSGWCSSCNSPIRSTCPHVLMTARQRRRLAKRER